ncbi:MAG: YkgJ family cysteine cluster protein [Proteobacteria bacterium]|nr:YkgJ family cysteine cluster protein [Pseudomonadota bacterium]MBU1714867.1 YkgJ family cysteine cluster protein [Pseudomonadota bacterium]
MRGALPDYVKKLGDSEPFNFKCNPEVECFTDCCRQLDLALTPYDVLRLKAILGISSAQFLDQYGIIDQDEGDAFPQVYLTMIDDGRASCPFVTVNGCTVYEGRPGACRTYPLGRGSYQKTNGQQEDFHVLLTEPHCKGFTDANQLTISKWIKDQGISPYNMMNDLVMTVLHHDKIRHGFKPTTDQIADYLLALYNLDEFRLKIAGSASEVAKMNDTELLTFAIKWLHHELFGQ